MAAVGRITGKLGSVYIDTSGAGNTLVKIADIFDWEYEENLATFNCTIKGEGFSRFRPGQNAARITIRRYVQTLAVLAPLVEFAIANGKPVGFRLEGIDGDSTISNVTGQGYVTRGRITAPQEKMVDEIEITLDGTPTAVT